MLSQGANALTDAELLAILLRTGVAGRNVLLLAQDILDNAGGLAGLLYADAHSLKSIKGLGGNAKRAEILAVMELARRATSQQLASRTVMNHPLVVGHYLQMHLAHLPHECFAVLFLDSQHRLIKMEKMFVGTLNQTSVYPREVALRALVLHAASVVLAHNHPSGHTQPSSADIALTRQLRQALSLVDVDVLDHVIVAQGNTLSMVREGVMPP